MLLLLSMFLTLALTSTNAETQTLSSENIKVDHVLEIRNGGLIVINDTVTLSASAGENVTLQSFLVGFPFHYRSNFDYCFAYDTANPESRFEVVPDVGLGEIGFFGVNVMFPESVDVRGGESFSFTVVFVFSDLIYSWVPELEPENALFNASFPMFPSLTHSSSLCNVTIILPSHSTYLGTSHLQAKGFDFNKTVLPTHEILSYVQSPLENFADELGWLNFVQISPLVDEYFLIFDVDQVSRDIRLDEWGGMVASDSYELTNRAIWNLTEITTRLPKDAYDVYAHDRFGALSVRLERGNETSYMNASITLGSELKEGATTEFAVRYSLPWREYINHQSTSYSELAFCFFEHSDITVGRIVTSVALPKGAIFRSSSVSPDTVRKNALQETVVFTLYDATPFHDLSFDLTYEQPIFWASFYPTLWMGIVVAAISLVFLLWRRAPKPPAVSLIPVSPKVLRSFVDAYEEKAKISSELESIEGLLRKGKVTRRRYKIRKKTLDGRLSALSRELANLREEIRVAGPRYASIMGQVEVAEALLEGVETDFRRAETQYRSGEISKSAYRRLIAEYERRKERAKTTIEGVLIRLREEIR